jgi:hypothetical protein
MADLSDRNSPNAGRTTSPSGGGIGDWDTEERWWRDSWTSRPYVRADRGFDYYAPAYRYGTESAIQYRGRKWDDVQADLERGWDKFKAQSQARWEDVKDAVRDAWDRVTNRVGTETSAATTGRSIS